MAQSSPDPLVLGGVLVLATLAAVALFTPWQTAEVESPAPGVTRPAVAPPRPRPPSPPAPSAARSPEVVSSPPTPPRVEVRRRLSQGERLRQLLATTGERMHVVLKDFATRTGLDEADEAALAARIDRLAADLADLEAALDAGSLAAPDAHDAYVDLEEDAIADILTLAGKSGVAVDHRLELRLLPPEARPTGDGNPFDGPAPAGWRPAP